MAQLRTWIAPWLILPTSLYWVAATAAFLSIGLGYLGALPGDHYQGVVASEESTGAICELWKRYDSFEDRKPGLADVRMWLAQSRGARCIEQTKHRNASISGVQTSLTLACARYAYFERELWSEAASTQSEVRYSALTRQAMLEEAREVQLQYERYSELAGPDASKRSLTARQREYVFGIAGTVLTALLSLFAFGRHASAITMIKGELPGAQRVIPRATLPDCIRLVSWIGGLTFIIAALVFGCESIDRFKSSYDWSSYCVDGSAFWTMHASILPMSVVTAIQLSAGFWATSKRHVPHPDVEAPRWGVGAYVLFLEVWCFAIVVLVGGTTAYWIHGLAANPSRTNRILSFLGIGALLATSLLVSRFVCCALAIRERCEQVGWASKKEKLPPDPTEEFLGKSWWHVPGLFLSAWAIAYWLIQIAGGTHLFTTAP